MPGLVKDDTNSMGTTWSKSFVMRGFMLHACLGTAFLLFCFSKPLADQTVTSSNPNGQSPTQAAIQKGSRLLSINPNMSEDNDYERSFTMAQRVGMQQLSLPLDWRDIEVHPGIYRNPYLKIANNYYPPKKVAVDLAIRPVSTNRKSVPDDLTLLAFSDAQMISRFQKLMDFVFSQTSQLTLSSIVIGAECDLYFKKDETLWKQYTVFCKSIAKYLRTRKAGVPIAFEATYPGLVGTCKEELKTLNQFSDVVGVSYYPVGANFVVKDPSTVKDDFQAITSIYPNRKLYFYQFGYPSSQILNSSEEKQAKFIEAAFAAWDAYATQIGMINFTPMTDCSEKETASQAHYFGLTQNSGFSEFLQTLGLRRYPKSGEDKPAFLALQREAKARGW
ncbi:MAG TPA: hypothetical protein VMW38_05850 [Terriglobia bacterium]|nr:hypothetical protein [Terriglobia bacterium]